jgi:hypothetical protein
MTGRGDEGMEEKLLHWPVAEGVHFHERQAAHFRAFVDRNDLSA